MKLSRLLLVVIIILGVKNINAQHLVNDYHLDEKVFIFGIITFDSIFAVKTETSESIICIEKSNLREYIDKDIDFYLFWELYPNSYKMMLPDYSDGFMKKYVLPIIEDTLLLSQIMRNYYPNGFPKLNYGNVYDNTPFVYHNLTCRKIKCNTFLTMLVPYYLYHNYIDGHVNFEPLVPDVVSNKGLSQFDFSQGLYVKMIYPLPFFVDN